MEKILLITPAHNEAASIGNVARYAMALVNKAIVDWFAVVDDHSNDRTAEIAKSEGATVLRQEVVPWSGKGYAFVQGLLYAKEVGAAIMVTIDADLKSPLVRQVVERLVKPIKEGKDMAIRECAEDGIACEITLSGQRAVRVAAFNFLFREAGNGRYEVRKTGTAARFLKYGGGYGLELVLNAQIRDSRTEIVEGKLEFAKAGKVPGLWERQFLQNHTAKRELDARREAVQNALYLREMKRTIQARRLQAACL